MAAATYFTQIQQIYIAFYQRPADPTGFKYWAERLDLAGGNLSAVIDAFATSPEAALRYGPINAQTISTVIDAIYLALFNKAPDAGGKQFYMDGFASGKFTAGSIALNVLNGATGNDAVSIAHKTQFAQEFTQQVDGRLMTDAYFGTGNQFNVTYSGDADLAAARTMLNGVTAENTSVLSPTQVTELLKAQIADATDPIAQQSSGQTFTLTTGADTMPGLIGTLGTSSTSGNDVIVGTELTLSSGDVINGGNGTDTLRVGNSGGLKNFSSFTLTGVENVQVTADGTGATGFDVTGATGVTKLINDNSSQDVTFTGAGTIPSVGLAVTNVSAGNTTVVFTADAVVGTADALTVALNGNKTIANAAVGTVTVNGIETVNVTTSGASSNLTAIASTSLNAMTVAGDKSLTLAGVTFTDNINVNTLNAAGLTGTAALNVTILANTATLDVAVTGGEGNDRADFSTGFDTRDAFTGGAGRDTLALTQAVATAQTTTTGGTVSGVEILEITNGGTGTTNMDNFVGVDTVYYSGLTGGSALAAASTISNAVTGLTVQVDVDAVAQDQTTTLKTNGTADVANYVFNKVGAADALGTVSAAQFETVNITTADDTTVLGTGVLTIANLTNTVATKLTIAGNAALTIANSNDPVTPVLATIDASTATAAVTISGTNLAAGGATVTLGSGNDVFNVATAAGADTFDLSKGGNDRIVYTAVAQSNSNMDTIIGFVSGSDDIDLTAFAGNGYAGILTTGQYAGTKATFAQAQGALSGVAAGAVAVFQADEGILWVDTDDNGTLDNQDFRVKLTGVTSLAVTDLNIAGVGNTISLTAANATVNTTSNSIAGTSSADWTTNNDDTINATVAFADGATVNAALGTDTLNIDMTGSAGGAYTVDLTNAAGGQTLDMALTSVSTVNFNNVVATQVITIAGRNSGENIVIGAGDGAVNVTTTATGQSITVGNTTGTTGSTVAFGAFNATATTGAAADTFNTVAQDGITISAGGANDTVNITNIAAYDNDAVLLTIDGGAGTGDALTLAGGLSGTLDFTDTTDLAVSAMETLNLGAVAAADLAVTLGAVGWTTVTGTTAGGSDIAITGTAAQIDAVTTYTSGAAAGTFSIATSDTGAVTLDLSNNTITTIANMDAFNFSASGANLVTLTLGAGQADTAVTFTAGTNTADRINVTGNLGAATLRTAAFDVLDFTAVQTGATIINSVAQTITANAGGTFVLGATASTFTGSGATAYVMTSGGSTDTITTGTGVDTINVAAGARVTVTTGTGGDTIALTTLAATEVYAKDFDFGGAAANDNLQLTASAAIADANGGAGNVSTAINAGNFAIGTIAVDTAILTNATSAFLLIAAGADNTAVALNATTAAIETAIAAQLLDGTDIAANLNAGEGFYGLIANDANADGTADSYFLFEYIADAGAPTVSSADDIILVGIFDGLDAATVNAGDFV